jgi:tRNA1(Val) A37 N6-methylase TrmN6
LSARGFRVARSRTVVPRAGSAPGRVLVEARKGDCQQPEEPPLVVHDGGGYTAEVRRMLGEDA